VTANALDAAQVQAAVDGVVREDGRIDILVNAVGGSTIIREPAATVDALSFEDWQRLIEFNLTGTFLCCHTVTPVMRRQGRGKISLASWRRSWGPRASPSTPSRPA
jgi:NAD(P)-dependent dehydrogenase (short-subunit alcohol dehydrogenase family)